MDILLQWTQDYIQELFPPDSPLVKTLRTTLLSPSSPLRHIPPLAHHLWADYLLPALLALVDSLITILSASPHIVAAAVILFLSVVILQVLSIAHRIMLFWTRLAFRLVFWAVVGLVASVVWQRGVERSFREAVALGELFGGWVVGAAKVWWREYERSHEQMAYQQRYQQGKGR